MEGHKGSNERHDAGKSIVGGTVEDRRVELQLAERTAHANRGQRIGARKGARRLKGPTPEKPEGGRKRGDQGPMVRTRVRKNAWD